MRLFPKRDAIRFDRIERAIAHLTDLTLNNRRSIMALLDELKAELAELRDIKQGFARTIETLTQKANEATDEEELREVIREFDAENKELANLLVKGTGAEQPGTINPSQNAG